MTPTEILDHVRAHFPVLYVNEARQGQLLAQALGMYQEKAGAVKRLDMSDAATETEIPEDFLECAVAMDANGRYHECVVTDDKITITPGRKSSKPYRVYYFVNLRDYDLETALPAESVSLLIDYLTVLLEIPNTNRMREIAATTGLQIDYPTIDDLQGRKLTLELAMEESQAIIPMATVY